MKSSGLKKYIYVPPQEVEVELMKADVIDEYKKINTILQDYSLHASSEGPGPHCIGYPGSGSEQC